MASPRSFFTFLLARLRGEVSAATLDAYARAGLLVQDLADELEHRRLEHRAAGLDPWMVPPAARAELLCAWNAAFLQGLGTDLLEADYRHAPATAGYVPPATAEQVLRFFAGVEAWLRRAQQAGANPDYRLDVAVPAPLPAWVNANPLPESWPGGMLQALRTVAGRAALAMSAFPEHPPADRVKQAQWNRIRQLDASARSGARYAEELAGLRPGPDVLPRADARIRGVIEEFHTLGQLIADPWLAHVPEPARTFPSTVLPCAHCGQRFRLPTLADQRVLATCPRCAHKQLVDL